MMGFEGVLESKEIGLGKLHNTTFVKVPGESCLRSLPPQ